MDLDDAYANAPYIDGAADYPDRWAEEAYAFREVEHAVGRAMLNQSYGDRERQQFDLFFPAGRPGGLLIFVHGGYWRAFDRKDWSHFAAGGQGRDLAVALPSYDLAPMVRISEITQQVAAAIDKIAARVAGPIYLAGHSAGGHLVARMLCENITLAARDRVVRVMPISPVSDLRPLIQTQMNADFRLDEAEAAKESPALLQKAADIPVHVWVGADERPAFLDQARWLQAAWDTDLTIEPNLHHFDVIDGLKQPNSPLMQALLGT